MLDEREEIPDRASAIDLSSPSGRVEFRDVDFAYREGESVLKDLSFVARAGSVTAICALLQLVTGNAVPFSVTALVPCAAPKFVPAIVTDTPL